MNEHQLAGMANYIYNSNKAPVQSRFCDIRSMTRGRKLPDCGLDVDPA